ncbi:hypothetical protein ACPOL_5903 [Acidisarcina polymorpha]|uniref:Uncharacterized protein n=1 Tax=Acidisarcina polymorpha TaxID=2211140 RepID=A0A2Z5G8K0_9BACT|nr:hypothetical protein [Acidisarcina polymorpha]AXC15147.1 hypothetical protein ACPOL_5903 [Acidisarcina polymorpha]
MEVNHHGCETLFEALGGVFDGYTNQERRGLNWIVGLKLTRKTQTAPYHLFAAGGENVADP